MIQDILAGLAILKPYGSDAPIVTAAYILCIPGILFDAVDQGTDAAQLLALRWFRHPVYDCYYYLTSTITELANVTGENDGGIPPYAIPVTPAPA